MPSFNSFVFTRISCYCSVATITTTTLIVSFGSVGSNLERSLIERILEILDKSSDSRDVTEILLETAFSIIQSIIKVKSDK